MNGDSPSIQWLLSLRPGDVIHTDREAVLVLRGAQKHKTVDGWTLPQIKRAHLSFIFRLRPSKYDPERVEAIWSMSQGYVDGDYKKWKVFPAGTPAPAFSYGT
jgi:hypothetical protein